MSIPHAGAASGPARRTNLASLRGQVDPGTLSRGQGYANAGRVGSIVSSAHGLTTVAQVAGSQRHPYQVVITWDPQGRWSSRCSCPVGSRCKHAVAVLLVMDRRAAPAPPAPPAEPAPAPWSQVLDSLVGGSASTAQRAGAQPMALGFAVAQPPRLTWPPSVPMGPTVRMWPLIVGKSGRWIKTGASWRDIVHDAVYAGLPEHVTAIRRVWERSQQAMPQYATSVPDEISLSSTGPGLWDALQAAQRDGVVLTGTTNNLTVHLAAPADLTLDLQVDDASGDLRLLPALRVDGAPMDMGGVAWVGRPVHGFTRVVLDGRATEVTIGGLTRATDHDMTNFLRSGKEVIVPPRDRDRFFSGYYHQLARRVPVVSHDASITLPAYHPPRLAVRAEFGPGHSVDLTWGFHYGDPGNPSLAPTLPAAFTPDGMLRDIGAERALVAAVNALPGAAAMRGAGTDPRSSAAPLASSPQERLTGIPTVIFVDQLLPALEDAEWAHVTVVGEIPEYRYADEPPLIVVSATDADGPIANDWFDLSVTVTIAGEAIPLSALITALARGETEMILPSGTWFSLDRPELLRLHALILEAQGLQDRPNRPLRLTAYHAGLWDELVELGVVGDQSARWQRTVTALLDRTTMAPAPLPAGLAAELRPYQVEGYQWLSQLWALGLGGILADDMGLGKTLQVLAMTQRAKEDGDLADPLLVVAPTSVLGTWVGEAAKFTPGLRVAVVPETSAKRRVPLAEVAEAADIVITTYAILRIDVAEFEGRPWRGLVLDEAQFVKNHTAKTYQCARRIEAPFKLAMTGTPLENSLMDLWSLLSIAAPGLFANPARFTETYRRPIESGSAPDQLDTLRRRIRPLMLRRTKDTVAADLPPQAGANARPGVGPGPPQALRHASAAGAPADAPAHRRRLRGQPHRDPALTDHAATDEPAPTPGRPQIPAGEPVGEDRHPARPARGDCRRGAPGPRVQSVHRLSRAHPGAPGGAVDRVRLSRRRHPGSRGPHRRVPLRHPARLPHQLESGGFRSHPHRGRLCLRHGPVVEPGRGEPGRGPHPPDRAGQDRHGLSPRRREHHRGEGRRPPGAQAGPLRSGGDRWRPAIRRPDGRRCPSRSRP